MYPYLDMMGYRIESYNVLTLLALVTTSIYFYHSLTSISIKKNEVITYILARFFVAIPGGMIIPFMNWWIYRHQAPWLDVWHRSPGRYFHSVFLSLLVYTLLACKFWSWPTRKILDRFMVAILLGSAIGRIGCILQGCCQGQPCDLPWAIHLPPHLEIARHPVQIYMFVIESIMLFLLWRYSKKLKRDGELFWVCLLCYSVYRFLIEFLRINRVAAFGLTHAQLFSVFSFGLSVYFLSISKKSSSKNEK